MGLDSQFDRNEIEGLLLDHFLWEVRRLDVAKRMVEQEGSLSPHDA